LSNQWTVKLEEDPETGELVLPFPPDLLSQMGWDFGDTLIWDDNSDGTFSIKKKVDNTDEKKV
jgi:hypothetical protein|tara:strand:- start:482 stop:670 length:189 start_codon:yes stop_codon:yes gene_type:complete